MIESSDELNIRKIFDFGNLSSISLISIVINFICMFNAIVNTINKEDCICDDGESHNKSKKIYLDFDFNKYFWGHMFLSAWLFIFMCMIWIYFVKTYKYLQLEIDKLSYVFMMKSISLFIISLVFLINLDALLNCDYDPVPVKITLHNSICQCVFNNDNFYRFLFMRTIWSGLVALAVVYSIFKKY